MAVESEPVDCDDQDQQEDLTIGRFVSEIDAARAYDQVAIHLFGEHAYLNFPDEVIS